MQKAYMYTRVSTAIQTEGFSLEAQKTRIRAYAIANNLEIVCEYEDAGRSGKSIEDRPKFSEMIEDIKSGKDDVSFVLVFKLSRFGRNAADVLSSLQIMQDFGANLICVDDGIDSSKESGKLIISVLSAVAEIERDNIKMQTMEGRIQKAREGKWNGGFPPYGYRLKDDKLYINEDEAPAIREMFRLCSETDMGVNGVAKYLSSHGVEKRPRQNGSSSFFGTTTIRRILTNPVYFGAIAYGRRKSEQVKGTRQTHLVWSDDYILIEGAHEAIVGREQWDFVQEKLEKNAKKYQRVNKSGHERTHLLTGLVKCPLCGVGMYSNVSVKKKKDGSDYKAFYYYHCKHRNGTLGEKCSFNKQINEELLDAAVAEVIVKVVSTPRFADMMRSRINTEIDTSAVDRDIQTITLALKKSYSHKAAILKEIDLLDPNDRHYTRAKKDLNERLYKKYDEIDALEESLKESKAKKAALEADKITADNIYQIMLSFERLYALMNEEERRQLVTLLIDEIQIHPEKQANGQWLKSIRFKLPIIENNMEISLDNATHVESVVLMSRA